MAKFKPVSTLLSVPGSRLEQLIERTQYLQHLTRILREKIDPVLSEHITVANIRGDTAIVATDSPAWLSKIRYLGPLLLQLLRQESGLDNLNNVHFKVQPPDNPSSRTQESRTISLSSSSAKMLESTASGIDDPELAEALRRLSRRGNPQPDD